MNARTTFPELPLDGHDLRLDRAVEKPPVGGETFHPCTQYRRLFGSLTPQQVMVSVATATSPAVDGSDGSPPALCDPKQAASHPLYDLLADLGHPSALSLASIAALRARHVMKGCTPETDAGHGSAFFWRAANQAWHDATRARSAVRRRELLIVAAAILIAQIDAEDFQSTREPTA